MFHQADQLQTTYQLKVNCVLRLIFKMSKYLKLIGTGLKYATYLTLGTAASAFAYLQYIGSQVGPIKIDRQLSTEYYIKQFKMDPKQAKQMYYWIYYDIAVMRLLTYRAYSTYCDRLNRKIIMPILSKYEESGLLDKMQSSSQSSDLGEKKQFFKKVGEIRKQNFEALTENEYIMKELRKQQKLMDTHKIVRLEDDTLQKINKIHRYICETGLVLKQGEVQQYVKQLPMIQARVPGDILHKIIFI